MEYLCNLFTGNGQVSWQLRRLPATYTFIRFTTFSSRQSKSKISDLVRRLGLSGKKYFLPGWGTKFGIIKCRATDIPEFQNSER